MEEFLLIAQIFSHKFDMNPVLRKMPFNNRPHVANALRTFTIGAEAGFHAGGGAA
jgi:hypothetical protein